MLRDWRRRSLPSHFDVAKSLYRDWLRQQLVESGLVVRELNESSQRNTGEYLRQLTLSVNAQGTLAEFIDFLYRFYQAKHLHRISASALTPTTTRKSLTISLTIDALSLVDCPRTDQLADGSRNAFAQPLEEIRAEVVGRNIFVAPGSSEPAAQQLAEQQPSEASQARITSMTWGAAGWQMSIRLQDSGQLRYFRPGDRIEIGEFSGEVLEMDGRRAVVAGEEGQVEILLGQHLGQARAI